MKGRRKTVFQQHRAETLCLPDKYTPMSTPFPANFHLPPEAIGYEMRTDGANGLVICIPVTKAESMPLHHPEAVIDQLHKQMGDDEGLIEVENGVTKDGGEYIYYIIKHRGNMAERHEGTEYTLNMNLSRQGRMMLLNASFAEEGATGVRDTFGYELFCREHPDGDMAHGWMCDPYDAEYTAGFLMNFSERKELDGLFPAHPLSEARGFVKYVLEHN